MNNKIEDGKVIDLLTKKRKPDKSLNNISNPKEKKLEIKNKDIIPILNPINKDLSLNYLPMTNNYSISYMQSDIIDNIYCTNKSDFIFTTSYDGVIQFWKKIPKGIEFVKKFNAHQNRINGTSINKEGNLICTCSHKDLFIKIFDIINFYLLDYISLKYYPFLCEFIIADVKSINNILAISEKDKGIIHILDINKKKEISLVTIHENSIVTNIKFNNKYNICLSTSNTGLIEYWSKSSNNINNNINNNNYIFGKDDNNEVIDDIIKFDFPKHSIKFKFKSQTDLFKLYDKTKKNSIINLTLSPQQNFFGIVDRLFNIYIFNFLTGKIIYQIKNNQYKPQENENQKIATIEKDIEKNIETQNQPNIQFDESEKYIYYPSWEGIKLINIKTSELIKIIGKKEKLRFISICLFQGESLRNKSGIITEKKMQNEENINSDKIIDPLLICTSYKSNRFYIFSKEEPDNKIQRDIINEELEEIKNKSQLNKINKNKEMISLPEKAVIDTTKGEIFIKLFINECPKTTKNFVTLGKRGYYDGLIFHRVIKNFMIQTGDPSGNGTGGESIYGKPFKDEFNENLKHEAFTVSMANSGPDTNGSQFFITTVPCHWLDNKHTVFGRVYDGSDVVKVIEDTKVDKHNKPYEDIKIVTIRFLNN